MSGLRAPVAVVSGARSFARHHRRAERMFRRAARAKGRTLVGFPDPLQYQAADAFGRFLRAHAGHAESLLGVELRVGLAQAQAAPRNLADAAPLAGHDAEHFADELLRRRVALAAHRAGLPVASGCSSASSSISRR